MISALVADLSAEAMRLADEAERAGPLHRACVARESRWAAMNSELAHVVKIQAEDRALLLARLDKLEHQLSRTTGERIRRLIFGLWRA